MRISDWSSDVCSSDLLMPSEEERRPGEIRGELDEEEQQCEPAPLRAARMEDHREREAQADIKDGPGEREDPAGRHDRWQVERGEPAVAIADRKSVVEGKRVSVRVDHGGSRIIKK